MKINNSLLKIKSFILNTDADFKTSIILSTIIGISVYIYVYGYKILNPLYNDWLYYQWIDIAQNYTGWLAFLHSKWQFPLLLTDRLTYPENISIFWTDSNPLFSIIFKLFSPLYNYADIQFIGFYSLLSLTLSSIFASQIVRYFNKNVFIIILGTFFLIYKPTVLHRLVIHANLSSQFFIYACIAYILYNYKQDNFKKDLLIIVLLFALAVSIHFYYVPMILSFMFFYLLYKAIYFKKIKYMSVLLAGASATALSMYILGVFVNYETSQGEGVGFYSFNLNSFWNPMMGWSFIKELPIVYTYQTDGFAYLGLGFLFLLIICISVILYNIKNIYKMKQSKSFKLIFLFTIIYITGIILIAMGGVISYNEKIIAQYDLSFLLSTFRGHGRFIWMLPIVFTVLLYILLFNKFSTRNLIIILLTASIIQIVEINRKVTETYQFHMADYGYNRIISKDDIAKLQEYGIKHVVLPLEHPMKMMKYTSFIIPGGWTESCSYTARDFTKLCNDNYNKALNDIKNNKYANDTIYIMKESDIKLPNVNKNKFYYKYDTCILILPVKIGSLEEIKVENFK